MRDGQYVTIQRTFKRWKVLYLVGILAVALGVILLVAEEFGMGFLAIVAGIFIQGMARGGAWWDNG